VHQPLLPLAAVLQPAGLQAMHARQQLHTPFETHRLGMQQGRRGAALSQARFLFGLLLRLLTLLLLLTLLRVLLLLLAH
jgi:hypothetical protein